MCILRTSASSCDGINPKILSRILLMVSIHVVTKYVSSSSSIALVITPMLVTVEKREVMNSFSL